MCVFKRPATIRKNRTSNKNDFFLPEGYVSQKINSTKDENREEHYWDETRIGYSDAYNVDVYRYVRNLAKNKGLKKVIDLGCGAARKLNKYIAPVADITAIDQKHPIEYCKKNYKVGTYLVDDLEQPSIEHEKYDLIMSCDVIEHLENPDILLDYIKHIANDDSYVVISTPERDYLRGVDCNESPKPEHVREWSADEFKTYVEDRGFEVLDQFRVPAIRLLPRSKRELITQFILLKNTGTLFHTQVVLCKVK